MNDWDVFTKCVTWFLKAGSDVRIAQPRNGYDLSSSAAALFPVLANLFAHAQVTPVAIDESHYDLLAWDGVDGCRTGWLCMPASRVPADGLHDNHKELLASFGGIVERFNEPEDTWLLNLNDALTEREASNDASFIEDFTWAFRDAGLTLPISPADYYSIAREANGNATLCHRKSGQIIMFAPDHCFDHITELEGCPEYTLYIINEAPTFRDWVNVVARQWLTHIEAAA